MNRDPAMLPEPRGKPKVLECARCAALFGIAPRPKAAHSAALQDAGATSWSGFTVPIHAPERKEPLRETESRALARPRSFSRLIFLFAFVFLTSLASAQGLAESPAAAFDAANRLYEQGKFSEAATAYEKLVRAGQVSEALYFNWGNALFKSGHIGQAIAAYQKAQQFAPRDPDLRANLQFARNQVQGPTLVPDKLASWLGRLSLNEWTWAAAGAFWSWLSLLTLGQMRPRFKPALRPYMFWFGLATACMLGFFGAALYFDRGVSHAIVIVPETTARQAPLDESQPAFTLHDGAEVEVLDQKDQWLQVQVDQRRTGWVHKEMLN
ncbi:MAG TPA: tetratricopeptide repeat protein [Verrucomicrobiae bacterium]|nr:tetratricopeptide repeat protein [Verrucomicrobiae bacterium]